MSANENKVLIRRFYEEVWGDVLHGVKAELERYK